MAGCLTPYRTGEPRLIPGPSFRFQVVRVCSTKLPPTAHSLLLLVSALARSPALAGNLYGRSDHGGATGFFFYGDAMWSAQRRAAGRQDRCSSQRKPAPQRIKKKKPDGAEHQNIGLRTMLKEQHRNRCLDQGGRPKGWRPRSPVTSL